VEIVVVSRMAKRQPENFCMRKPLVELALDFFVGFEQTFVPGRGATILRVSAISAKGDYAD